MMKPLPKSIRDYIARHPEKFREGWTEDDHFEGDNRPWSHWLYLKPGWANTEIELFGGMHVIHEASAREALRQYRRAKPCTCDDCRRHETLYF